MNRVSRILGIKLPIIQAPMSWITSAELAAAVSNAGGMGTLGPHAGHNSEPVNAEEIGERLRQEIVKTKKLTNQPFGINYSLHANSWDSPISQQIIKVMLEENVKIIVVAGWLNVEDIKRMKKLGFIVIFREITPTVAGAKAAEAAGADIIVATGFDEGGSTPASPVGTMTIVPLIVDAVNVPVLATGGIVDRRRVNASLALGAEGVYIGTRFIVAQESPAHAKTKEDIIEHGMDDLILIKTPYGGFWRATPHTLALQAQKIDREGGDSSVIGGTPGGLKMGMLDGKLEEGIVTISSAIDSITEIQTAKEIVDELMADYSSKIPML